MKANENGKGKLLIILIAAVCAVLLCAGGVFALYKTGIVKFDAAETGEIEVEPTMLMFLGSKDDVNIGELYIQKLNAEKERLAETAIKDQYVLAPKTQQVLLLNKANELYLKTSGAEKYRVSADVMKSSFCFSKDESTVAFLVNVGSDDNASADLYVQKSGKEKEKVASGLSKSASMASYKISDDGESVLFLDGQSALYSWNAADGKEKIANGVKSFEAYANNKAITYANSENVKYVKFANDTETQKVFGETVEKLQLTDNGMMAVFESGYNKDKGYGELYVLIRGGEAIKLASNVKSFLIADNNNLYYLNDENALYLKKMPEVGYDTYKNISAFADEINKREKIKLGSDVTSYEVSSNGKNSAFIDTDKNLYLSYNEGEKIKVAPDVTSARVFDSRLVYLSKDNQLFLNSVIGDAENIKENNKMIIQCLKNYNAINGGKNIIFSTSESDAVSMITNGAAPKEIIQDCKAYDIIISQEQKIFEKKLTIDDIAGIYKNNSLGVAYKITPDKKFILFETSAEKENSPITVNGINRLSAELKSTNAESILSQNSVTFSMRENGKIFITIGGSSYELEKIDDNGLKKELERQKKIEDDKKAAAAKKAAEEKAAAELQARKDELAEQGYYYMSNGVYLAESETLYYSPHYNDASDLHYINGGYVYVYDYNVSSDGNTLWLKVDGVSYGYLWVAK